MPGEKRTLRLWPAAFGALVALVGLLPAAVAADSPAELRGAAAQLKRENADLAARSRGVVLELYALDSRLARERARLVSVRIRTAEVKAELALARQRLAQAQRSLDAAQLALARRLQLLYEQGDSDPMAVVLGASSVADALSSLDSLDRMADQDDRVVDEARQAKRHAAALARALQATERNLGRLAQAASASAKVLEGARVQRSGYLASLARTRRLKAAAIARLQTEALRVEAQARQVAAASPSGSAPPVAVGPGGRTLTVVATGYSMRGETATGVPAGWGVVAVDPSVIPLGTRLAIPGYGSGVAADTGSAIRGAAIDLWFPTVAQARAWGRRSVTIALR